MRYGLTAFQELKGLASTKLIGPFRRNCGGTFSAQAPPRRWRGVGRTSTSNEHILLTQGGVLRCSSVRRLELEERHYKNVMESATGPPCDHRPPFGTQHPEGHVKNQSYHEEPTDRWVNSQWTDDQEQSLRSFTRLTDKPQAVRHVWECDEDFAVQWLASTTTEVARGTRQRERKHRGQEPW